jgi:hypothetical protein
MRIKNITRRGLTLNFSRRVFMRPGAELVLNSAQAKKAQVYQNRGLIKIMGTEGARITEVAQKAAQAPVEAVKEIVVPPAPPIPEVVEAVVDPEPVVEVLETVEEPVEGPTPDLDAMDYQELKELGDSLEIKARGKTKLLEALKEHYS